MPLTKNITYQAPNINSFKDISQESVLEMLSDVKRSISELESSFTENDSSKILDIIEEGFYNINGSSVITIIDLSDARGIINGYKQGSEPGCGSCVYKKTHVIDAQDAITGNYCGISDPGFSEITGMGEGQTAKIGKHYNSPCGDWKPHFSPTIEKLIEQKK